MGIQDPSHIGRIRPVGRTECMKLLQIYIFQAGPVPEPPFDSIVQVLAFFDKRTASAALKQLQRNKTKRLAILNMRKSRIYLY